MEWHFNIPQVYHRLILDYLYYLSLIEKDFLTLTSDNMAKILHFDACSLSFENAKSISEIITLIGWIGTTLFILPLFESHFKLIQITTLLISFHPTHFTFDLSHYVLRFTVFIFEQVFIEIWSVIVHKLLLAFLKQFFISVGVIQTRNILPELAFITVVAQ